MQNSVHHFDGWVSVWAADPNPYRVTETQFALDYGDPILPMPDGIAQRFYRQGLSHALMDAAGNVVSGGPMPWPEGDDIIAAYSQLTGKVAARTAIGKTELDMGQPINQVITGG